MSQRALYPEILIDSLSLQLPRSLSESAADFDPEALYHHDEIVPNGDRSAETPSLMAASHVRRSTDPGPGAGALRTHMSRLSVVQEDRDDEGRPSQGAVNFSRNDRVDVVQGNSGMRVMLSYAGEPSESQDYEPIGESSRRLGGTGGQDNDVVSRPLRPPPSYRTTRSTSRGSRHSYLLN